MDVNINAHRRQTIVAILLAVIDLARCQTSTGASVIAATDIVGCVSTVGLRLVSQIADLCPSDAVSSKDQDGCAQNQQTRNRQPWRNWLRHDRE
jgi:hypothetical protein